MEGVKTISETKIREILNAVNKVFGGEYFGTYQAKEYLTGTYDEIFNRFMYMERIGFLDSKLVNGSRKFCITSKGFKLLEKEEKVVDKVVNKGKSDLIKIREDRIIKFLKENPQSDKFQIHKVLKKYEQITPDSVYQALRKMETDDLIFVEKDKNKNFYSILKPQYKPQSPEAKEIEQEVVIHEPEEILNDQPEPIEDNCDFTIGQILDLVWPHCKEATPYKPSKLKNMEHERMVAKFSDQKTLLDVFHRLPANLQEHTRMVIDEKHRKIQLSIPIEA